MTAIKDVVSLFEMTKINPYFVSSPWKEPRAISRKTGAPVAVMVRKKRREVGQESKEEAQSQAGNWSEERLRRLFGRYNRIYWHGKLSGYRVVLADLYQEGLVGSCELGKKLIKIDPHGESDREVRATLLHEMAHAASRSGHTVPFFAQLERLLKRCAPVKLNAAEVGRAEILADVVPKRFPLLRARIQRAENRHTSKVLAWIEAHPDVPVDNITTDRVLREFEGAEAGAVTWKRALIAIGLQYGLTDESGRPVNGWAKRIVSKGRKVHSRARFNESPGAARAAHSCTSAQRRARNVQLDSAESCPRERGRTRLQ
jgi:hypothetical protein